MSLPLKAQTLSLKPIPTHMHDAMHAVYVHACEGLYVVLPFFC